MNKGLRIGGGARLGGLGAFGFPLTSSMAGTIIPQYQITSSIQREDFESAAAWTSTSGNAPTDDTTHFVTGAQSIRLANGASDSSMDKVVNWTLGADKHVSIDVYLHTGSSASFALLLSADAGYSQYWQVISVMPSNVTGWQHFDFTANDWTGNGGILVSQPIVKIRVRTRGVSTDLSYDNLCTGISGTPTAAVMFTWDDVFDSVYTVAYPLFLTRNVRASGYVVSDKLDVASYITTTQMLDLYNNGWMICNHTKDHIAFTGLTQAQVETALNGCKTALEAKGISGNGLLHVGYPGGVYTANSAAAMAAFGALTGRIASTSLGAGRNYFNNYLYYLPSVELTGALSLASAKAHVDNAYAGGKVVCFYGHKVVTGAPGVLEWKDTDLADLMDYIISKDMYFLTVDDFYRLHSGSVTIP